MKKPLISFKSLKNWVKIRIFENLQDPFNYGDGQYQLLYLLRSNLANILIELNSTFWMIQQVVVIYYFYIHSIN